MQRRVAITGMGVVSPLGNDVDTMFARLTAGESAIRRLAIAALRRPFAVR